MKLIYQGFDGLDVTFQGMIPSEIRYQLKDAKEKAQNTRSPSLVLIGDSKIPVHVADTGGKGGYKYRLDTGIDREIWFIADSDKSDKWNIRVSVKSMSLALYGYRGVKRNILNFLKNINARGVLEDFKLLERISRVDYCFDFVSDDFTINPKCIHAHSRATRRFIGGEQLLSRHKNIETVMIGKMPNRQIVIYDKKKEVAARSSKEYWWDIWGIKKDEFNRKIFRVEIRAGKDELDTWNLKRFADFEKKIGDVLLDIANSIRYVKPNMHDTNSARWKNKEFWDDLLNALQKDLLEFSSNAKRGEIIYALKIKKIQGYKNLITNLITPYMAITDRELMDLPDVLKELSENIKKEFEEFPEIFSDKIQAAKEKFIFLD